MKEIYLEIEKVNLDKFNNPKLNFRHDLNVFFTRLLFCFFAEDTKVFSRDERSIFTNAIKDCTQTDGSDLGSFLQKLFDKLDSEESSNFSSPFSKFPYVNGTLFDIRKHNIAIPKFNPQARKLIIECGSLNWSEINPDIFGSMFQSITIEEHRSGLGMHYTSVPNIMKVIEPLFLDELRDEFDNSFDSQPRLVKLLDRVSKIKIFDPACGSGNFLIIVYKELRKIEHGILKRIIELKGGVIEGLKLSSSIKLDNFYGIEIDDFAHEIAILSLYLAKHQMNIEFEKQFGKEIKLIPLKENANIVFGNAARVDWQDVCPNKGHKKYNGSFKQESLIVEKIVQDELIPNIEYDEIYVIGNPPYQGGKTIKDPRMKEDVRVAFSNYKYSKNLDYISIWFIKGAQYICNTKAKLSYVSTNSICQGEQVGLLWPYLLALGIEIQFVYTSFKWKNNAKNNAGVTCIIIGLSTKSSTIKKIYGLTTIKEVKHINPYLTDFSKDLIIFKKSEVISSLPKMELGNMAKDGGGLIISKKEADSFKENYPKYSFIVRELIGAEEFLKGNKRYCLWIEDIIFNEIKDNPFIKTRLNLVIDYRTNSKAKSTNEFVKLPWRFIQRSHKNQFIIFIPSVTSERRKYIPMGIYDGNDTVVVAPNSAIYNAELWLFGLISSRMHMTWMRSVAGRLKTDYRYSSTLVYNTFPVPPLNESQKLDLDIKAREVLFARENYTEKTLAEMYNPDKMPVGLQKAHRELDLTVDRLYRSQPYKNDEERLVDLFKLYEFMINQKKGEKND